MEENAMQSLCKYMRFRVLEVTERGTIAEIAKVNGLNISRGDGFYLLAKSENVR